MVIINPDKQECHKIRRETRSLHSIRKRRNSSGGHVCIIDIKDLPPVSYSHLFINAKRFFSSSVDRLKNFGRYLNAPNDFCAHCQEYRQLLEAQKSQSFPFNQETDLKPEKETSFTTQRFSDVFVAKVQSQQQYFESKSGDKSALPVEPDQGDIMPKCCAACRRPRAPVEVYCACEDAPRRVVISGMNRPPPTRYYTVQRRKNKSWWCCKKKDSDCWNHCQYCHQKIKRPVCPPYMYQYPPDRTFLQKFKQYVSAKCQSATDMDMYNAYVDNCNQRAGLSINMNPKNSESYAWCTKRKHVPYDDLPLRRTRSYTRAPQHSSNERVKCQSDEEYVDEPDSDSDDCCCCCPCRKCFNTTLCQTDMKSPVEPKDTDTQTDHSRTKRRCCRCCRNACTYCQSHGSRNKCTLKRTEKTKTSVPHNYINYGQDCTQNSQDSSPTSSPRRKHSKPKTIMCRTAGVQIEPNFSAAASFPAAEMNPPWLIGPCQCSKKNMQNVMFSTVNPTPLFLDKMFQPISTHQATCNFSTNPLDIKLQHQYPFISPSYGKDQDSLDATISSMTIKTKKRFVSAVCDSILGELNSKRRTSLTPMVNSPDSGYQEAKIKANIFSPKKSNSKIGKYTIESMIKTLKGQGPKKLEENTSENTSENNVMGEASKVVRGILEEITSTHKESSQDNLQRASGTTLHSVSLRNILLNVTHNSNLVQSRSDSILLDNEVPGGSTGVGADGADVTANTAGRYDESYTKLMHALDVMRNKNRKMTKVK